VEIIDSCSLFGVRDIVFLKNGDHFCLFQNTIFRLNSRVLCECLVIKDLQKRRISFDSHKYPPPSVGLKTVAFAAVFVFPIFVSRA
jgi:hypothetical protein